MLSRKEHSHRNILVGWFPIAQQCDFVSTQLTLRVRLTYRFMDHFTFLKFIRVLLCFFSVCLSPICLIYPRRTTCNDFVYTPSPIIGYCSEFYIIWTHNKHREQKRNSQPTRLVMHNCHLFGMSANSRSPMETTTIYDEPDCFCSLFFPTYKVESSSSSSLVVFPFSLIIILKS